MPILSETIVKKHRQIQEDTCVPSSVELVLKLIGVVDDHYYELQKGWYDIPKEYRGGIFFDGKTYFGVTFKNLFPQYDKHPQRVPRGINFPIDQLFKAIDTELAQGRYVIIALPSNNNWHNWVIYLKEGDDYKAVSHTFNKGDYEAGTNIKHKLRKMGGTDIIVYTHSH